MSFYMLRITKCLHYNDVKMDTIASQITSLAIILLNRYSDTDQRKHQNPTPLAFVWGIHRDAPQSNWLIVAHWHHIATWNRVNIGSGHAVLTAMHQQRPYISVDYLTGKNVNSSVVGKRRSKFKPFGIFWSGGCCWHERPKFVPQLAFFINRSSDHLNRQGFQGMDNK